MKDTIYIYMDYYKEVIQYELNLVKDKYEQTQIKISGEEVYHDIYDKVFNNQNYTITKNIERGKQEEMESYLKEILHQQEYLIWKE